MTGQHAAQTMLVTRLSEDGTLLSLASTPEFVWDTFVPEGIDGATVVFQLIPGGDDVNFGSSGATRAMSRMIYQVTFNEPSGNVARSFQGQEAIDDVLHGRAEVVGGYTLNVQRIETFSYPVFEDGKRFSRSGGRYEILARE